MGYRRVPFAPGEWYHCFNRGIDKRVIYEQPDDFKRFAELLYLANDTKLSARDNFRDLSPEELFSLPRSEPLVSIGGWCLMHNHYHLLLKELVEGGISKFMHKLGTGYTQYFNLKHNRIGNLLVKPFRSKHIDEDRYLRRVADYIHLNPVEIFEPGWKKGVVRTIDSLDRKLLSYTHSSLPDYHGASRAQRSILDPKAQSFLRHPRPNLKILLQDMAAYYQDLEQEFGAKPRSTN